MDTFPQDRHVTAQCGCFFVSYGTSASASVALCIEHTRRAMPIWDHPDGDPVTVLDAALAGPVS